MKKPSIDKAAMLGSASALGLNWIYDRTLLEKHKKEGHPMIFEEIDHDLYKQAKTSYDVYPNHQVGELDFMGEVYYFTYMFLTYEEDHSLDRYRTLFYEYFREDYEYDGYVESYGKDLLQKIQNGSDVHTDYIDKQLIGLIFILAVYEKEQVENKEATALNFARVFTAYDHIKELTSALYYLLVLLDQGLRFKEAALQLETYLPALYKKDVLTALTDIDIDTFLTNHSGVACGLEQSLPLIFYILAHTNSWEEAMVLNATLGGASSARGIFISTIASRYYSVPDEYNDKLIYQLK